MTCRLAVLLLVLTLLPLQHRLVAAQTSLEDQLAAVLLTETDLPGFQQTLDDTATFAAMTSSGTVPAVVRDFASPTGSIVALELIALPEDDATTAFTPATIGEQTLRDAANALGTQPPSDFALLGPLGLGEDDLAATWTASSASRGTPNAIAADIFLRGHVLGLVLYSVPGTEGDASTLGADAGLQDARIVAAQLP
jgi:hypothetical protein